ncbi:MAG: aminotransferase class V-fold PLP-dependent enzyme [Treponema sp.]|uniref:pyridoxal-phosphate-dependent aminotransferase family protein n=1 Tax=Treponema sp. TaxID=166 RepID=UPI002A9172F6|nr:aminotransferase class V-fold PLP-dependent enzyme [Treponema sp.]MDY6397574.1 aminotransferase class V-fold PLP-dependent enzyme [Treponema sp.]
MINFTVGPVQMDEETRELGKEQIPYFRTPEFSSIMKENEKLLCNFFDAPENSRVIFMTGSGTASMEGGIMNFFNKDDKVIVVNGGSFGHRLVQLCEIHEIPFTEIKLDYGTPLTKENLAQFENVGYTGFLVQLCETSTGVLYDMELIGDFCNRNGIFLFVDAVSGFMADKFSMKKMHVNAAITGSQKALALPPSMSFTVLDKKAIERCNIINVKNLYFNYPTYLKDGERGQTPFTPAVGTLLQLNAKLKRIEETGGIENQNKLAKARADYFRNAIKDLPFALFSKGKDSSNCVTALCPTKSGVNAHKIFEIIKDEYGIWICPNGGDMAEKVFRVGHIGSISKEEINTLIEAFKDLVKRGIL